MSCIAGVGGVAPLVETATSGQPIVAIDSCQLECAKQCLDRHDVSSDHHYNLAEAGVSKDYHADYDEAEAARVRRELEANVETLADAN